VFTFSLQFAGELGAGGRLTGALQAEHHDTATLTLGRVDHGFALGAHHGDQFVVADLDELIGGRDAQRLALMLDAGADGLPYRFLLYALEKAFNNVEFNVGLQKRQAHFAQRGFDVLFIEGDESRESILGFLEASFQRLKHRALIAQPVRIKDTGSREPAPVPEPPQGARTAMLGVGYICVF
jgi:hypothetical protein